MDEGGVNLFSTLLGNPILDLSILKKSEIFVEERASMYGYKNRTLGKKIRDYLESEHISGPDMFELTIPFNANNEYNHLRVYGTLKNYTG